jgi:hypothetical protein
VILLSSKQQPYDRNRGGQVGADDHIDKPFDTQQLIDKVNTALKKTAGVAPPAFAAAQINSPVAAAPPAVGDAPRQRSHTLAYGAQMVGVPAAPPPVAMPAAQPPVHAAPSYPAPAEHRSSVGPVAMPVSRGSGPPAAFNGQLADKLVDLGLSPEQVTGVLLLSREVLEKVVWEVVPVLAETMIREEIKRLTND